MAWNEDSLLVNVATPIISNIIPMNMTIIKMIKRIITFMSPQKLDNPLKIAETINDNKNTLNGQYFINSPFS